MDSARYAEKMISEALARGELEPQEGVGKPLKALDNDPDWWIRAFFERERMPERFVEMQSWIQERTNRAVAAADLASARALLVSVNADVIRWNERVDAAFQLEERSEVWLVTERARRPVE